MVQRLDAPVSLDEVGEAGGAGPGMREASDRIDLDGPPPPGVQLPGLAAYLMIGMSFAFSYRALGALQAGSFFGPQGEGTFSQDLFFSFTTLTTTGYGNLVPAANPGQSFAVGEMLLGQLFLVTAVAKVVSTWRPGPGRGRPPTENDSS